MKLVKIKFKKDRAKEIAEIMGNNGFVNLLSWQESGGLFDDQIIMFVAVPSEKSDTAEARFQGLIQKM